MYLFFDGNRGPKIKSQLTLIGMMDTVIVTNETCLRIVKSRCCEFNNRVYSIEKLDTVLKIIKLNEELNHD